MNDSLAPFWLTTMASQPCGDVLLNELCSTFPMYGEPSWHPPPSARSVLRIRLWWCDRLEALETLHASRWHWQPSAHSERAEYSERRHIGRLSPSAAPAQRARPRLGMIAPRVRSDSTARSLFTIRFASRPLVKNPLATRAKAVLELLLCRNTFTFSNYAQRRMSRSAYVPAKKTNDLYYAARDAELGTPGASASSARRHRMISSLRAMYAASSTSKPWRFRISVRLSRV